MEERGEHDANWRGFERRGERSGGGGDGSEKGEKRKHEVARGKRSVGEDTEGGGQDEGRGGYFAWRVLTAFLRDGRMEEKRR